MGPDGAASRQIAELVRAEITEACRRALGRGGPGGASLRADGAMVEARTASAAFEASLRAKIAHNQTYVRGVQQDFLAVIIRVELRSDLLARAEEVGKVLTALGYAAGVPIGLGGMFLFERWMQHMAEASASGTFTFLNLHPWAFAGGLALGLIPAWILGGLLEHFALSRARVTSEPQFRTQERVREAAAVS